MVNFTTTTPYFCYAGRVDLNNLIHVNETSIKELEATKAEKFVQMFPYVFDDENSNFYLNCIHHDNFHRSVSGADIGQNGTENHDMSYTNLDGENGWFRIVDNELTLTDNASGTDRALLCNNKPGGAFMVLVGLKSGMSTTYHTNIVFNYNDYRNYEIIEITKRPTEQNSNVNYKKIVNNSVVIDQNVITIIGGSNIKAYFVNNSIKIYCCNSYLCEFNGVELIKNSYVGMRRFGTYAYYWTCFNVYDIQPIVSLDSGYANDKLDYSTYNGLKSNGTIIQTINGTNFDYLYNANSQITRFSGRSERFELRYLENDDDGRRRSEVKYLFTPVNNLYRMKMSFDVYFPDNYAPDTYYEIITQAHLNANNADASYAPVFCIRTENGKIQIKQWGNPNANDTSGSSVLPTNIIDVVPGSWVHFDIFIKFGYMPEHNPLVKVAINNELVYRNENVNTCNSVYAPTVRYGIYKYPWFDGYVGNVTTRVLYFDNFKLSIF